jgi:hypothetical protein
VPGLSAVHGKPPRARRPVRTAARGALLPAVAVALALAACTASPGPAGPAAGRTATGPDSPASCTGAPLKAQLAGAVQAGASLIVAAGTPTGRSVPANQATAGAPALYAMTLTSVQTLRGPAVASGTTGWVQGPGHGTTATPENSALLAPGGMLFAIAWPPAAAGARVGPVLQLAPVVGTNVVFTPYACWNLTGLLPGQYQESTSLRPVQGGANYGGTHQAAENGLYTVPLGTVRQIAASA